MLPWRKDGNFANDVRRRNDDKKNVCSTTDR